MIWLAVAGYAVIGLIFGWYVAREVGAFDDIHDGSIEAGAIAVLAGVIILCIAAMWALIVLVWAVGGGLAWLFGRLLDRRPRSTI